MFTGPVGYQESGGPAEQATVQISAPRVEVLPETGSYSVTFAPELGPQGGGSFVPVCQLFSQLSGAVTGGANGITITMVGN